MSKSIDEIIDSWKNKQFAPVYWLEGDEPFYIQQLVNYAEEKIISSEDADFNLKIFYGRDSSWTDVHNACNSFPMFGEKQVVIIKEAQFLKDIEKLESYIENPIASTLLIIAYKDKKLDNRTLFAKKIKKSAVIVSTKKLYDNQLPDWLQTLIKKKGLTITPKALMLLIEHIGNDLTRLEQEVEKLTITLDKRKNIVEEDILTFIGVSREFNVFELQEAIAKKDLTAIMKTIQYFEHNPKAAPLALLLPTLYNYFSKVYALFGLNARDEKAIAQSLGVHPFFVKDYLQTAKIYGLEKTEKLLLLLHQYNLKNIGVYPNNYSESSLLKELVYKALN